MNLLSTFMADAATTAGQAAVSSVAGAGSNVLQILFLVVPLGLMYFILIVPQRKKEKKQKQLIEGAIVGDTITTIGGVVGKVVNIKDDEVTIETSVERSKVTFKKWAIKDVNKPLAS